MQDIASIILASATLVTALGSAALSFRNSRKIEEVHKATNGMKTELVKEVRAAALAAGEKTGAAKEKAKHE